MDQQRGQRRRPAGSGYARGEETRGRIVATAIAVFSAYGYDEASTRRIAERAKVNLAALNYYFGSKQTLYCACAEHIAEVVSARFDPIVRRVGSLPADGDTSHAALLALLRDMLDMFMDAMVEVREPQPWVLFVIREQTRPSAAFDILYERVMRPLIGLWATVIGRFLGRPADDPEVMLRTLAILGQLTFFRRGREVALRALGWPDLQGERLAKVKDVVWGQLESALLRAAGGTETEALAAVVRQAHLQGISARPVDDLVQALGTTGISKGAK